MTARDNETTKQHKPAARQFDSIRSFSLSLPSSLSRSLQAHHHPQYRRQLSAELVCSFPGSHNTPLRKAALSQYEETARQGLRMVMPVISVQEGRGCMPSGV